VALDLASAPSAGDDRFSRQPAIAGDVVRHGPDGPCRPSTARPEPCAGRDRSAATSAHRPSPVTRSTSARITASAVALDRRPAASCGASISTGRANAASGWRGLVFVGT
jgi:hypothetical protein